MLEINYSIIIPHKNIAYLLVRCVCSIPKRDDLEIIIIDDGSDEKNLKEINACEFFKRKDVSIIYNYDSKGGGYARNIGLKAAKGKWVLFADADDFFMYCLNEVLDEYAEAQSDVIYFPGISLDTNTYMPRKRTSYVNKLIETYKHNPQKAEKELRYLFGEPWCKLIRRDMIKTYHITFDETFIHNDTTFSYLIGYYARMVDVDSRAIYCVTTRENSVSISINESKEQTRIEVFARAEKFFREKGINTTGVWHYRQLAMFLLSGRINAFRNGISIMGNYIPIGCQAYLRIVMSLFHIIMGKIKRKIIYLQSIIRYK